MRDDRVCQAISSPHQGIDPQQKCTHQSEFSRAGGDSFHLLNQFDLPPGSHGIPTGGGFEGGRSKATYEITEWSVVSDQKNGTYSIKTFESPDVTQMRFADMPLSVGAIKVMPPDQPQQITILKP